MPSTPIKSLEQATAELATTTNPKRKQELETYIFLNAPRLEHGPGNYAVRQRYDVWEIPKEGKLAEQFLELTDEEEKKKFIVSNATRKWRIGEGFDDINW